MSCRLGKRGEIFDQEGNSSRCLGAGQREGRESGRGGTRGGGDSSVVYVLSAEEVASPKTPSYSPALEASGSAGI